MASTDPAHYDALGLRGYLDVLRRRWRWLAGSIAVLLVLVLGLTATADSVYEASSKVLIRQLATESLFTNNQVPVGLDADRQLNNELEQIRSGVVVDAVEKVYDGPLDVDSVRAQPASDRSDAVWITAQGRDPDQVTDLVNIYTDTYIRVVRSERVDELLAAGAEIQQRIDDLRSEEATEERSEADIQNQIDFYQQQYDNLELSAGIAQTGGVRVLTRADVPTEPVSPTPVRNGILAVFAGALVGIGVAFVRDHLDDAIRTADDIERATGGAPPVIGIIPRARESTISQTAIDLQPDSPAAEAYRALRTAVRFSGLQQSATVIQVTSSVSGEGKTTTAANLAVALAEAGQRVVVVCCDLRRPMLHEIFQEPLSPGLTDLLVGDVTEADVLRTVRPRLHLLTSGSRVANPSELLSSTQAELAIRALAQAFDYVVIDSAPLLPVTDGLVTTTLAQSTILVVGSQGGASRAGLKQALSVLRQANASVLGFVLNRADNLSWEVGYRDPDGPQRRDLPRRAPASHDTAPPRQSEPTTRAGWTPQRR